MNVKRIVFFFACIAYVPLLLFGLIFVWVGERFLDAAIWTMED